MPVISLENCRRGRGRERSERLPRAPSSSSSPGGRARWPWRRWVLSDKSQLAPCLTGLARREPGGGSAWQEPGTSARAPCSGGEGRADSCQPEPQTVPGLGFFWVRSWLLGWRSVEGMKWGLGGGLFPRNSRVVPHQLQVSILWVCRATRVPPALCSPKTGLGAAGPCPLLPTCSILAAAVTSSPGKPRNDPVNSSSLSRGCLVTTRSPSGAERFQLESRAGRGKGTSSQLMLSPLCHPLSCFRVCSLSWLICSG